MGVAKGEATRASTHELGWTSKSVLEKELKAYHGRRSTGRLAIWFVVCAVLVYSIIAPSMFFFIPGEAQRLNRYRSTRQLIPNSADLHLAGAVAFASTLAGELAAALVSSEPQAMVPSMGISICGAICYLSIGYELTPVFQSPIDGTLVYPLRNLTWMTTTMIQLFLIWAPSKNRVWQLICAVVMCNIMLGAGMMTSLVSSTSAQYSWLGVSLAGFCGTMFLQWRMVDSLVEINKDLPSSQASLRRLQKLLPLLWSVFAAVHIMCIVGLLDDETSARFMIVADVATKCAISLVVSQGIITTGNYQLEKVTHSLGISLGEFDRRKNEMLATTTHELRTPINGIIGLTDAMIHSQKILDPKVDANLRIIRDTGRRLDKLIGCIMDSAMMMESKLYLVLEEVDIHKLLKEASNLISPLVASETKLSVELPERLPLIIADSTRLMQVLFNVLGNAAKFTSSGSITLSARVVGPNLQIKVDDTGTEIGAPPGIGISDDKLDTIFEPFAQADQTDRSRKMGSSGLGLTVTKRLIEAHHGTLSVESVKDKGTSFTITLPLPSEEAQSKTGPAEPLAQKAQKALGKVSTHTSLNEAEAPETPPQEANHRDSMDSSYSTSTTGETEDVDALSVWLKDRRMEGVTEGIPAPKTLEVLSVDDEAVNQYVMEDLMTHSGFKYTKAMDARECLNILSERFSDRGVSSFPDIILMDQRMPHMTGLEATKLIRSRYPTSKVPIIMLSANNDEASIVEGLEVGCNDYICKPFKRSELLARVALQLKVLELHKKEVEARQHVQILKEILPVSVIDRLKRGQTQIADELDNVTILVSDVVGFAGMARSATASKILEMLDKLFTTFDQLVDKHGVFKVETHGDSYVVICGHDRATRIGHASRMLKVAMDMINSASSLMTPTGSKLQIRVGIHSGPAYAGVVGYKCPRYCLFGDSAITADMLQKHGSPMTVHLSSASFQLLDSEHKVKLKKGGESPEEFYTWGLGMK